MTLKLYTCGTPNGYKISIYLEILKLKFETIPIQISQGIQKQEWFLKLNPNGRIPTLVDESTNTTISESAAILMYLADTYDKERKFSYLPGTKEYFKMLEVSFFQMAGIGPMQGQGNWFLMYAPEKIPYAIDRYVNETKRLYSVLDEIIKRNKKEYDSDFLVGPHISIADVLCISWVPGLTVHKTNLEEFPNVLEWATKMLQIPEVRKGFHTPNKPPLWNDKIPSFEL
ncbi:putative glutathione S-transferase-like protein Gedep [[Candida] jaroonii]|uniref:Glutathione S-transferase-like protein Gedep n=1 Tax=[Candida] jaroonii TaxID=467808 RepID=A0ACA9YDC8_9ASCO|nr:putative glutathione S-transferase-like protein Gedep [[Candida] jaroonii]